MAKRRRGEFRNKSSFVSVEEGAEFFKVFLPNLSSHQLKIPPDFTKHFRKRMKDKFILKNEDGKTWYVDVKETPDGVLLKDGWQSFVHCHSLKLGELLVFRYVGSFSFLVKIFGVNGCKKEALESKNITTHVIKSEETSDSDKEMESKQTSRELVKHSSSVDRSSKHLKRFGEVNEAEEEALDETCDQPGNENRELNESRKQREMSMVKADSGGTNPCFSIVLVKTHLKEGRLCVPVRFWRAHLKRYKRSRKEVTLWVENHAWNVGMVFCSDNRVIFGKGCTKFLKDNSLQVGTWCTFQLIATNHLSFKVTFLDSLSLTS